MSLLRNWLGGLAGLGLIIISTARVAAQPLGPIVYTPYAFATLAGQAQNQGTNDGTGSQAQFSWPEGIAVDHAGTLFVTDQGNDTIRRVLPDGTVSTIAGSAGEPGSNDGTNSDARFNQPSAIASDGHGGLFVADTYNHTIRQMQPQGTNWVVTTIAGYAGLYGTNDGTNSDARFNYPYGLALDHDGSLLVGDLNNNTIRRVSGSGTNWVVTTFAGQTQNQGTNDGPALNAQFRAPFGLAVDATGNIYVADNGGCTIRKITRAGTNAMVSTITGQPDTPGISDGTNNGALFYYPGSIALDGAGNLLICDSSHILRRMTPSGVVTTLAGAPGNLGTNDGIGSDIGFSDLTGVAVDAVGNVYVLDYANALVRRGFAAGGAPVAGFTSTAGFNLGKFAFDISGPPGTNAVVQVSPDLSAWTPVWTNLIGAPPLHFEDAPDATNPIRFYRVELQ